MAAHLTQANLVPAVPFDWFLSPNEGRQAPAMRPKPAGPPGRAGPVSDLVVGLRLPPEQEEFGLDEAVHGEGLYKGSGLKVWPSSIGCPPAPWKWSPGVVFADLCGALVAPSRGVNHPKTIPGSYFWVF